jgi:hypothetical protein
VKKQTQPFQANQLHLLVTTVYSDAEIAAKPSTVKHVVTEPTPTKPSTTPIHQSNPWLRKMLLLNLLQPNPPSKMFQRLPVNLLLTLSNQLNRLNSWIASKPTSVSIKPVKSFGPMAEKDTSLQVNLLPLLSNVLNQVFILEQVQNIGKQFLNLQTIFQTQCQNP